MAVTAPKPRVKPRLKAATRPRRFSVPPDEWSSLLAELSPGDLPPQWRAHDRTHLEFAIDYPLDPSGADDQSFIWEAYFFIPQSLRLDPRTYDRRQIYQDLRSYVRYAVRCDSLDVLADKGVQLLRKRLEDPKVDAIRELRVFDSKVRTSITHARRVIHERLEEEPDEAFQAARAMKAACRVLLRDLRALLCDRKARGADSDAIIAGELVDEDLSRLVETTLASLSLDLGEVGAGATAAEVASAAVVEARYRRDAGYGAVGHASVGEREVEHLEYRRHLLKRFGASALRLARTFTEPGRVTVQFLYAIAASVAMGFAVLMALYHGPLGNRAIGEMWMWAVLVVAAYAAKDRIKASLQGVFTHWLSGRLPDRRWTVRQPDTGNRVGIVFERSAFRKKAKLPAEVLAIRNTTRSHPVEEFARPEQVLWHRKDCTFRASKIRLRGPDFSGVTEVFRMDLHRWLTHTDDPKQRIVFADPDDEHVYSAFAARVYNLSVVYRLRRKEETNAPWHRVRVVVSRKGIRRVEQVC